MRTVYSGLVDESFIGQTVTLYGWAHRRRDHGGVIFIGLRDREGLVQVVCDPDRPDVFATADKCRNEYCLKVVGLVRARPEGTKNENLISGGVEVLCQELEILSASATPPFNLDDQNLSETTRLTYRILDLRRLSFFSPFTPPPSLRFTPSPYAGPGFSALRHSNLHIFTTSSRAQPSRTAVPVTENPSARAASLRKSRSFSRIPLIRSHPPASSAAA